MEIEAAVLESDEDAEKTLGDAVARREAPLTVCGRPGPEELALRAEEHRRNGVGEPNAGQKEPEKADEYKDYANGVESAALKKGDTYPRYMSPARACPGFLVHRTISIHCPFVLAWMDASYIASTATPGW
jgi:hypothetical protein